MEEKDLIRGTYIIANAINVYNKIGSRLNKLKKRQVSQEDIEYIREWVLKLYEIDSERDYYEQKLLYAKRAFIFAFIDPYTPPKNKKKK